MAQWSNRSKLVCFETLENLPITDFWIDLNILDAGLQKTVDDMGSKSRIRECSTDRSGISMELESEFEGFLLEVPDVKKNDADYLHLNLNLDLEKSESSFTNAEKSCKVEDARRSVESDGGTENRNNIIIMDDDVDDQRDLNRKRKRECYDELLNWIVKVAKNPCNSSIGSLPERSKWKYHGNDQLWKRVLLAREQLFLKRNANSSDQQSIWQKKQKMHPTVYEDYGALEKSRSSQRILSAKENQALLSIKKAQSRSCMESSSSSAAHSDVEDLPKKKSDSSITDLWVLNHPRIRIPVGSHFQAKVHEWTGEAQESDSKWLGTQVWPLDEGEKPINLIERDRIGKGRQDSCGCQFPGSVECVQFHISEKRKKLMLELSSAFRNWEFDKMGEQISLSWTEEEEKKFQDVMKLNSPSMEHGFFKELYKIFPGKSRGNIVSYFFNVFLLRQRSQQNRNSPNYIDSDDEELGLIHDGVGKGEINSKGSIFRSPRKVHLNSR